MSIAIGIGLGFGTTGGGGSSLWTPEELFGAGENGVWYDPSDLSTMWTTKAKTTQVANDGDSVGYIADKSGNGVDLSNPNDLLLPTYHTNGTLHWLTFNGIDQSLKKTISNVGVATVVCAFDIITGVDASAGIFTTLEMSEGNIGFVFARSGSTNTLKINQVASASLSDASHIWVNQVQTAVMDFDDPTVYSADGTGHPEAALSFPDGARIGLDRNTAGRFFWGGFYGLVSNGDTAATILSTEDRNLLEEWMAEKAGVTL